MSNDLSGAVRDALDERAQALDVRTPSWQELEAGFGRVRRTRRRHRAARTGGVVVALALAAGGVQGGVLPYPTWAPSVAIAASPSALDTGRVRGSLAGDTAWLAAFREVVVRGSVSREPEGTWRVPSPEDVHVLYASDVGGHRIALVEYRKRAGLLEARRQGWWDGARGARADELQERTSSGPQDRTSAWFDPPDGVNGAGLFVAVAAQPQAYLLAGTPEYAADGTPRASITRIEPGADGVVERVVRVGVPTVVQVSPATKPYAWEIVRTSQVDPLTGPESPDTFADGRRVPDDQRRMIHGALTELVGDSGLVAPRRAALWAGPMGAWSGAVVAVTAPSGARLVHVRLEAPVPGESNARHGTSKSTVLPAGRVADVAVAWQMSNPDDSGDDRPVRNLGVFGPVGATSARLVDGDLTLAEVRLTDRAGLLPPPPAGHEKARVRFTDAAGKVLTTVGVLDLHATLPTGLPQ